MQLPTFTPYRALRPGPLLAIVLLAAAGAVAGLVPGLALWWLLTEAEAAGGQLAPLLAPVLAIVALALLAKALGLGLSSALAHRAAYGLLHNLRRELALRIARLPQERIDQRGRADLARLLLQDVDQLEDGLAHALPDLAAGLAVPLAVGSVLLAFDWRLALAALAMFPLLFLVYPYSLRRARAAYGGWYGALADLRGAASQYVQGMAVLRASLAPGQGFAPLDQAILAVKESGFRAGTATLVPMSLLYTGLRGNVVVLLPVAAALWLAGAVDLPVLVLFLVLGLGLNASVLRLIFTAAGLSWKLKGAAARLAAINAEPGLETRAPSAEPQGSGLVFEGVSLGGTGGPRLDGIDLEVPAGQTLAIVGPTGAGKSTLLRLALRFCDPESGQIRLGGADLRQIPPERLAAQVSAVLQDAWLADDSIAANILAGRPGASPAELARVADLAQVSAFAARLPGGLSAPVGPGGQNLSGGERQRVAIARALLRDAPLLLLDEVTAALDPENEEAVLAALTALRRGRTVIVVAHRLATIRQADRIAVMEAGRVVATGRHEELLVREPLYARLWQGYEESRGWHLAPGALRPVPEPSPEPAMPEAAESESAMPKGLGALMLHLAGPEGRVWFWRALPLLALEGVLMGAPVLAVTGLLWLLTQGRLDPTIAFGLSAAVLLAGLVQMAVNQRACRALWQLQTVAVARLQQRLARHLRALPLGDMQAQEPVALEELITRHAASVNFVIPPAQAVKALTGPLPALLALALIDWRLALVALASLPPILLVLRWGERANRDLFTRHGQAQRRLAAAVGDWLAGSATRRGLGIDAGSEPRLLAGFAEARDAGRATVTKAVPPLMAGWVAVDLGWLAVFAAGGALVAGGAISLELLVLALVAALAFFAPLGDLFEFALHMRAMRHSMSEVSALLARPVLREPEAPETPANLEIAFENVSLALGGRPVLAGFNARFAPGRVHAITGPSGAGKSTLLGLIGRFRDPDAGRITIGGVDLRQIAPELRVKLFAVVFQTPWLFADSVEANLRLARPGASRAEIEAATRAAGCHARIMALPEGYATRLGAGGAELSGGERQQLTLARALLHDAPIVLLDEATASIDPENEAAIRRAMAAVCAGRTVIVIAHRPSTLAHVASTTALRLPRPPRCAD